MIRESAIAGVAGSRVPEALCAAYGVLGRARRRYQIAQTLPSVLFNTAPDASSRWAWDCAFPSPYTDDVRSAEAQEGLPAGLIWAVMRQESGFDPDVVSPARAVGLMQVLPDTARLVADELSIDQDDARLTSPSFNVRVGAHFMRELLDRFHGDIPLAVAAYKGAPTRSNVGFRARRGCSSTRSSSASRTTRRANTWSASWEISRGTGISLEAMTGFRGSIWN